MAITYYQYDKVTDFTSLGGPDINGQLLELEIIADAGVPAPKKIKEGKSGATKVDIGFDPALDGAEETALDAVVAAHLGNFIEEGRVLPIKNRDLTSPPGSPVDADRYIIASGATGAWAGQGLNITQYSEAMAGWMFCTPMEGTALWVEDENVHVSWNGTDWEIAASAGDSGAKSIDIDISYSAQRWFETKNDTYQLASDFLFRGTDTMAVPSKIKALAWTDTAAAANWIRIYDVTNSQVICETSTAATARGILDLGTISNVSAAEAIWECQIKRIGGGGNDQVYISAIQVQF